jgi:hypothetical protein
MSQLIKLRYCYLFIFFEHRANIYKAGNLEDENPAQKKKKVIEER